MEGVITPSIALRHALARGGLRDASDSGLAACG